MEGSKITHFFKHTKSNTISKDRKNDFYEDCLLQKIENCSEEVCHNKKNGLKLIIKDQEDKLKQIEEAIKTCLGISDKKKIQIEKMKIEIESSAKKNVVIDGAQIQSSSTSNVQRNTVSYRPVTLFEAFSNDVDSKGLAKLRSLSSCKKDDSKFVLNAIRFLYKNDTEKIASLSLSGRSREAEPKNQMTPRKRKTIENLFTERLNSFDLDESEYAIRSSKVGFHIKNAFGNIRRTAQQSIKTNNL